MLLTEKSNSGNDCYVRRCLYTQRLCDIHGGSLPSPIVSQKGSNLALVKADAQAIHSWSGAAAENLDQVLDANTLHQVSRLCLKELLTCIQQRQPCHPVLLDNSSKAIIPKKFKKKPKKNHTTKHMCLLYSPISESTLVIFFSKCV